jgi:acyl-CoA thioester hydrolase
MLPQTPRHPAAMKEAAPLHTHETAFQVRDYECDMGHVVNHAAYLNYLEHARHELLGTMGLRFGNLAQRGVFLVVTRLEADYKASLVSGDAFVVRTELHRKGRLRLQFNQHIYRTPDHRLMLSACITGTALNAQGRPEMPEALHALLKQASMP